MAEGLQVGICISCTMGCLWGLDLTKGSLTSW